MRYLHPVGISERFLASGTYELEVDGVRQSGWSQEWSVHRLPDSSRLIRIDEDERATSGRSTLIEVWISPPIEGSRIGRIDFIAYGGRADMVKRLRATYNFFDDRVEVGRTLDSEERRYEEISMPAGYVRSASAVLFIGLTAAHIAEIGEERQVVSNKSTFDNDRAFEADVSCQIATYVEERELEVKGRRYRAFRYDRKIDGMVMPSVWLNEKDILLRCDTDSGKRVILTEYAQGKILS